MTNIAEKIISKFPSPQIIADLCNVDVSTVHRWKYPRERGGQNGLIPAPYQQVLLNKASEYGVELRPDDFFFNDTQEVKQKYAPNTGKKGTSQDKSINIT